MVERAATLLLTFSALVCASPLDAQDRVKQASVSNVTVPLVVELNRPFVTLTFERADGSLRSARFLLDTGGGGFLLTEPLARDLGLTLGSTFREEGREFARVEAKLTPKIGAFPLALIPQRIAVIMGRDNVFPSLTAGHAEGMVPGHVLAQYHVVFDYPASKFTIALPGVLIPDGTAIAMPVSKGQGFPRTQLEVGGAMHGMLLDTGASFTMVSEQLLKAWGTANPDWERHQGAFGEAATLGGQTLETMFIPNARWGATPLQQVGVTSQRSGTFENYMSKMMTAPIVGSLAGNVLKQFRVELDYSNQKLYLKAK